MLNNNTGQAQQGVGVWTVANQTTNKGQASYQWTVNDMATKGDWWVYTTVKLPAEPSPREFDPELIEILAGTVGAGAAPPGVLPSPSPSLPFLNIRDYGGVGDGVSDNTTAIFNARAAARALGGARILYGTGVFLTGNQDISNDVNVYHEGSGVSATIIKLKNGANTDLFSAQTGSINLAAANGTGPAGTLHEFGFSNMTLDGNKANQSSGPSYPLRFYGYDFKLSNLHVRNGFSGGILSDWNAGGTVGTESMEAHLLNVKVHHCGGIGIQWGGPHDSQFTNILSFLNDSHGLHVGPNASAVIFTNCHSWGPKTGVSALAALIEGGYGQYSNCVFEGSDTVNVALLIGECSFVGCHIFGAGTFAVTGLQIGQAAGGTPYNGSVNQSAGFTTAAVAGGYYVSGFFSHNEGTHGTIWFVNDGGGIIQAQSFQTAGFCFTGSLSPKTLMQIHVTGLTADGSQGKGGTFILPINAFSAFVVRDDNYNDVFNLNTNSKLFETVNGTAFKMWKDGYGTPALLLNRTNNGEVQLGNSSSIYSGSGVPSSGLGANGDFYFRTDTPGTANQRLYVKSAGAWSGIL